MNDEGMGPIILVLGVIAMAGLLAWNFWLNSLV